MSGHASPHRAAMEALDEAEFARRRGDDNAARESLRRALILESKAANAAPLDTEPTRSVLYRSAASIAAELGDTIQTRRLVFEALRGEPPTEIKAELFEVLDSLAPTRGDETERGVLQQVRIRTASAKSGLLTFPSVTAIHRLWLRAIDELTDGMSTFVPVDAGVGSFVVQFAIEREGNDFVELFSALDELQDITAMMADKRLREGPWKKRVKRLEGMRRVIELLTALAEADAVLEVTTHGAADEDPRSLDLHPPTRKVLKELQRTASGRISSNDVPQADDLERVLRFVELLASGQYPTPKTLEVVGRQVSYYRRAAEILGYVRDRRLTPGGRILVRSSGAARWRVALARFAASDIGSAWIEWSEKLALLDVAPDSAADFLRGVSVGLSEATIVRRAKTLTSWRERLAVETARDDAT